MSSLSPEQQQAAESVLDLVGPLRLRYCPLAPTARQEAFLRLPLREVLYGGAAGGGKTIALMMAALMYCDVPGYHALILRPSLPEFDHPGGLIELSQNWLAGTHAHWTGETRSWRFPSGATLRFGYLDGIDDVYRYSGSSFSFLGFDELVRFGEPEYRRMFRTLRQPHPDTRLRPAADGTTLADVPVRVRATSNPGGTGHAWVKARFVDPNDRGPEVAFLSSQLSDNPHLDPDYIHTLAVLPHAERERLLRGNWEIPDDGDLFQRAWFDLIERHQLPEQTRALRFWDLAATEPSPANPDPDYTVGLRLDLHERSGTYYVTDVVRVRRPPGAVEQLVAETASSDGKTVAIVLEQEPGAAGKSVTDRYKQQILRGFTVKSSRPTGAKAVRAQPVAAAAENGLLKIVRGRNTNEFLDEICAFPYGPHDDCVDALAGAHEHLTVRPQIAMTTHRSQGRIPTPEDRFTLDLGF